MKKIYRFLAIGLLPVGLALAGCSREMQPEANQEKGEVEVAGDLMPMRFAATGASSDTKTTLKDGQVFWESSDAIMVYANGTGTEFTVESLSEESDTAFFKGKATLASEYYAIYPSSAAKSISDGVISATIPSEQTVNAGGMPANANLSVAKAAIEGADTTLYFMNVGSLLKFKIKESVVQDISKITSIVIRGLDGEKLSGTASITVGEPEVAPTVDMREGVDYVKLSGKAGDFKADTFYYVCIAPVEFKNGFTVEFLMDGALMASATSTKGATIARAVCANIGTVALSEPAYKWKLVDGSKVKLESNAEYAIAYPDPKDDEQYLLFSFQKYLENAGASTSRTDLKSIKLSKLKNATKKASADSVSYLQTKSDLYKILRQEAVASNYCNTPGTAGASEIGISSNVGTEVAMKTSTFAFGYDAIDCVSGTFSATVDGTEYSFKIDTLVFETASNKTTILYGEPDSLSVTALYKYLRGGSYIGFTWDQLVTGEGWVTDGSTKQKWDYVSTAMGDEKIPHLYDGTFFRELYEKYNLSDVIDRAIGYLPKSTEYFQYYPHSAIRFKNMIYDETIGGFAPVLCFDLNCLGTYAFAAIPAVQGVDAPSPTWGTEQVRTRSNNMNWGSDASSDLTGNVPYHWVNAADDGITYTMAGGTSKSDIWPVYNFDGANRVYIYKKTTELVGAK